MKAVLRGPLPAILCQPDWGFAVRAPECGAAQVLCSGISEPL